MKPRTYHLSASPPECRCSTGATQLSAFAGVVGGDRSDLLAAGQALGDLFGGSRALEALADTSGAAPIGGLRLDAEICSRTSFRLVPIAVEHTVGIQWRQRLSRELRLLAGKCGGVEADVKECARQPLGLAFSFPLASFKGVCQLLRASPFDRCHLELPPSWVVSAMSRELQRHQSVAELSAKRLDEYIGQLPAPMRRSQLMMAFQKDGVRFGLSREGRCLLADEMGLGKTLQALVILAQYQEDWPVLVVVPATLRLVWKEQAFHWLPHILHRPRDVHVVMQGQQVPTRAAKLVIVSYDLLTRCPQLQFRAEGGRYGAVVIDESHYIKSCKSARAKVVLGICRRARRCVLISGTPALNRPEELYTQLIAICPDIDSCMGFSEFNSRYCGSVNRYVELNSFLASTIMTRHMKADVLKQLPEKVRQRITLEPHRLDAERMREVQACIQQDFDDLRGDNEDLLDLKHVPSMMRTFQATAEAKIECVCRYVEHILSNNVKFLLFAHHYVMLDGLERKLCDLGVEHIRIDGRTEQSQRMNLVNAFQTQSSVRVALLSITACGQGLTLTAASTVIFAELYWVPGQLLQAEDRCHRIGQKQHVDVHYCIAENTLDERIFRLLNRKHRSTSGVLDGTERGLEVRKSPLPCTPASIVPNPGSLQSSSAATEAAVVLAGILSRARLAKSVESQPLGIASTSRCSSDEACHDAAASSAPGAAGVVVAMSSKINLQSCGVGGGSNENSLALRKRLLDAATPQGLAAKRRSEVW